MPTVSRLKLSSVHIKRPSSATLNGLEGPAASYQDPNSCLSHPFITRSSRRGGGYSLVLSYQSTAEENTKLEWTLLFH